MARSAFDFIYKPSTVIILHWILQPALYNFAHSPALSGRQRVDAAAAGHHVKIGDKRYAGEEEEGTTQLSPPVKGADKNHVLK